MKKIMVLSLGLTIMLVCWDWDRNYGFGTSPAFGQRNYYHRDYYQEPYYYPPRYYQEPLTPFLFYFIPPLLHRDDGRYHGRERYQDRHYDRRYRRDY